MELVQLRRSTSWLLAHATEAIDERDVTVHDLAACLGEKVVVEDLDGALHLAVLEPVVGADGALAVLIDLDLRITMREAVALGVFDGEGAVAPWATVPSLMRTFRR